jgi:hypothetical protein
MMEISTSVDLLGKRVRLFFKKKFFYEIFRMIFMID